MGLIDDFIVWQDFQLGKKSGSVCELAFECVMVQKYVHMHKPSIYSYRIQSGFDHIYKFSLAGIEILA